jgi:small subunit ribosomal protein S21
MERMEASWFSTFICTCWVEGSSVGPQDERRIESRGGELLLMAEVRVKENESFESALKRFKRACEKAGILSEIRKHQHFEKPSEKKKKKVLAARRRGKR